MRRTHGARDAVSTVRCSMPPGTLLRHRKTGVLATIGEKHGMSSFWLMAHVFPARKGVERAETIVREFEAAR